MYLLPFSYPATFASDKRRAAQVSSGVLCIHSDKKTQGRHVPPMSMQVMMMMMTAMGAMGIADATTTPYNSTAAATTVTAAATAAFSNNSSGNNTSSQEASPVTTALPSFAIVGLAVLGGTLVILLVTVAVFFILWRFSRCFSHSRYRYRRGADGGGVDDSDAECDFGYEDDDGDHQAPTASRDHRHAPKDPQKPFTIMFTDIQNSTALWAELPELMGRALDVHHKTIRSLIKLHKGYEVKTVGDCFMIAFQNASDAVALGHALQQEFYAYDWGGDDFDQCLRELELQFAQQKEEEGADPAEYAMLTCYLGEEAYRKAWRGLRVRVGVHTGLGEIKLDEVTKAYDYYGTVVNTAAGIESCAYGGQVIVSDATRKAVTAELTPHSAQPDGRTSSISTADDRSNSTAPFSHVMSATQIFISSEESDKKKTAAAAAGLCPLYRDLGFASLRGLSVPVWLMELQTVKGRNFGPLRDVEKKEAQSDDDDDANDDDSDATSTDDSSASGQIKRPRRKSKRGMGVNFASAASETSSMGTCDGGHPPDRIGTTDLVAHILVAMLSAATPKGRQELLKSLCKAWRLRVNLKKYIRRHERRFRRGIRAKAAAAAAAAGGEKNANVNRRSINVSTTGGNNTTEFGDFTPHSRIGTADSVANPMHAYYPSAGNDPQHADAGDPDTTLAMPQLRTLTLQQKQGDLPVHAPGGPDKNKKDVIIPRPDMDVPYIRTLSKKLAGIINERATKESLRTQAAGRRGGGGQQGVVMVMANGGDGGGSTRGGTASIITATAAAGVATPAPPLHECLEGASKQLRALLLAKTNINDDNGSRRPLRQGSDVSGIAVSEIACGGGGGAGGKAGAAGSFTDRNGRRQPHLRGDKYSSRSPLSADHRTLLFPLEEKNSTTENDYKNRHQVAKPRRLGVPPPSADGSNEKKVESPRGGDHDDIQNDVRAFSYASRSCTSIDAAGASGVESPSPPPHLCSPANSPLIAKKPHAIFNDDAPPHHTVGLQRPHPNTCTVATAAAARPLPAATSDRARIAAGHGMRYGYDHLPPPSETYEDAVARLQLVLLRDFSSLFTTAATQQFKAQLRQWAALTCNEDEVEDVLFDADEVEAAEAEAAVFDEEEEERKALLAMLELQQGQTQQQCTGTTHASEGVAADSRAARPNNVSLVPLNAAAEVEVGSVSSSQSLSHPPSVSAASSVASSKQTTTSDRYHLLRRLANQAKSKNNLPPLHERIRQGQKQQHWSERVKTSYTVRDHGMRAVSDDAHLPAATETDAEAMAALAHEIGTLLSGRRLLL